MFERYIASLDGTLKELRPCMAVVKRTLKRLDESLGPVGQPKPLAARGFDTQPRVVTATPVAVTRQGTIIKYIGYKIKSDDGTTHRGTHKSQETQPTPPREALESDGPDIPPNNVATPRGHSPERVDWGDALNGCKVDWGAAGEAQESLTRPTENKQPNGPSVTYNADKYRKSRVQPTPPEEEAFAANGRVEQPSGSSATASTTTMLTHTESQEQPTPPGETPGADGPNAQHSNVLAPHGDYSEGFDWRVDLRDNTYKYERLGGPVGSPEQAGGRDTPFRTTATLNLQSIRLLRRWSDEPLSNRGGFYRESPATREDRRYLGPADSPVSHTNLWEWAVTQHRGDKSSSVYDGGGERIPETPQDMNVERVYVTQPKGDTSSSVYDGGGERIPETPPDINDEKTEEALCDPH